MDLDLEGRDDCPAKPIGRHGSRVAAMDLDLEGRDDRMAPR